MVILVATLYFFSKTIFCISAASIYLDLLDSLFEPVVPEAIINPLSNKLERRLRTKRILGWHVQIIQECEQLLATNRHVHTLGKGEK